jgi:cell pole-organizing protein PopZ
MAKADMSQEPTMEEILASIRRIISEDDEGSKPAAPVMELTRPIEPDPAPVYEAEVAFDVPIDPEPPARTWEPDVPPAAPARSSFDIEDEIEFADRHSAAASQPSPQPIVAPNAAPGLKPRLEPAMEEEPLVGAPAAAMAADAFARLSKTIAIAETPNQTLEGMVREMMKPLLRAWLDEHLPRIVEDKVEQEVARLARRMR